MNEYPELLILRHGETQWNREGRLQGELDSPLTQLGEAQAAEQGRILMALKAEQFKWRMSPQGRARRTAEIAKYSEEIKISEDNRLREIGMGKMAGLTKAEMAAISPDFEELEDLEWYNHVPGGEGVESLGKRCQLLLDSLAGPTVLITHGITSRVLRCLATGRGIGSFSAVGGGQGIVYRIKDVKQEKIGLQDLPSLG